DQLANQPGLLPPVWNERSVVEITGSVKKKGWFLHALTGDEWLLTLKFRVRRNRFKQDELRQQIPLKNLDDLDELPIYGRSNRVRAKNLKGPWQEISLTVHWQHEIETDAFQEFLKDAAESFLEQANTAALNLKTLTPWSVLGPKWHLSRKGFPSNKRVHWKPEIIEVLADAIRKTGLSDAGDWTGKSMVSFREPSTNRRLCTIHTKRRGGVDLTVYVRAGRIALGGIAELGAQREIRRKRETLDAVIIRFSTITQARANTIPEFLKCLEE
ncbi:MAG: excinuclease ABC subunit A, partial [Planctomycetaceae bacterium]